MKKNLHILIRTEKVKTRCCEEELILHLVGKEVDVPEGKHFYKVKETKFGDNLVISLNALFILKEVKINIWVPPTFITEIINHDHFFLKCV